MTSNDFFLLTLCLLVVGLSLFGFAGYVCLKRRHWLAKNLAMAAGFLLFVACLLLAWLVGWHTTIVWHTTTIGEFIEMLTHGVLMLGVLAGGVFLLFRFQYQKSIPRLTATSSLVRLGNTNFARLEAKVCNEAESRVVLRECKYLAQFFEEREGRLVQVSETYGEFEGNVRVEQTHRSTMIRAIDAQTNARFGATIEVPPHETIVEVHLTVTPERISETYAFDQTHVLPQKPQ